MFTSSTVLQAGGIIGERPEAIWLALGTALMLIGTIYFLRQGWGVTDPEQQEFYIITIMITGIATGAYLSMFFGFGLTEVEVAGRGTLDIYWARYADWLFTTPLLLLDLALLANASRTEIGALIILDAFMIVTGLVGALTEQYAFRFIWWAISTLAMILVLYFLYSVLTERVQSMNEEVQGTFTRLRNLVLVLWTLYPILWIVGTEGAGVVNLFAETLGFMILDVLAKVGFGFILLRSRAILGDDEAPASVQPTPVGGGTGSRSTHFDVYEDNAGEYRWRLRTGNNRTIGDSGEGYASKGNADRAVESLRGHVPDADTLDLDPTGFEVYEDKSGEYRWRLRHKNGNILADSGQGYASKRGARQAVETIRDQIGDAEFAE